MQVISRLLLVVAAATLCACASTGSDQSPAANGVASSAAESGNSSTKVAFDDPDRVVCKKIIKTGTRIRSRQCLTLRQWHALEDGSQDVVSEVQRRASQQQDMPGQGG